MRSALRHSVAKSSSRRRLLKLPDYLLRMKIAQFGTFRLDEFCQAHQPAQVGFDDRPDARPAYLDHHLAAVFEAGTVPPCDGSSRQGLGVGYGWRAVLKFAEFSDPLGFEQIHARREHLAELDEGRPKLLKHAPRPCGWLQMCQLIRMLPEQRPARAFH